MDLETSCEYKNPPTGSGGVIVNCVDVLLRLRAGPKGRQETDQVIKANST